MGVKENRSADSRRTVIQQINQPLRCADPNAHTRLADGVYGFFELNVFGEQLRHSTVLGLKLPDGPRQVCGSLSCSRDDYCVRTAFLIRRRG